MPMDTTNPHSAIRGRANPDSSPQCQPLNVPRNATAHGVSPTTADEPADLLVVRKRSRVDRRVGRDTHGAEVRVMVVVVMVDVCVSRDPAARAAVLGPVA